MSVALQPTAAAPAREPAVPDRQRRRAVVLFVLRRLGALLVSLVVVGFGVFLLLYLAPGSPEHQLLGGRPPDPATVAALRARYHLDDPFFVRYLAWLGNVFTGDLGTSTRTEGPVLDAIGSRIWVTLELGFAAFAIAMVAGISLGVTAALRRRTVVDRGIVAVSIVGLSAPAFITGTVLLLAFSVGLGWLPAYGAGTGLADRATHLVLPSLALALAGVAVVVRLTRAAMITTLEQDYVAFARARGVPFRRILVGYALRNALVPVVTAAGLVLGTMLTGAVVVEVVFNLPGIGTLLVDAVKTKDIAMVQGLVVVFAAMVILINLVTDLVYLAIDPRIAFERGQA